MTLFRLYVKTDGAVNLVNTDSKYAGHNRFDM